MQKRNCDEYLTLILLSGNEASAEAGRTHAVRIVGLLMDEPVNPSLMLIKSRADDIEKR